MNNMPFMVKTHDIHLDAEYREWIQNVKQRYQASQIKAAVKVNSEALLFNWQLGRDFHEPASVSIMSKMNARGAGALDIPA